MTEISKKIIGFEKNLSNLINNFSSNNLHQSLIFFGEKGIGKKTFTYYFINKIYKNIENNSVSNTSNLIYNNSHPNVKIVEKLYDEKNNSYKNNIHIDQIREIENFIYQSTFNNLPKFIIIDPADDLNINSSNALLKILEEPKKNTYFILINNQISLLLPTIRSRCIKVKFSKQTFEQFKNILMNNNNFDKSTNIDFLYDLSLGSPGLALKLNSENIEKTYNIIIDILSNKNRLSKKILEFSEIIGLYNNEQFKIFLSIIKFILINSIKINFGSNIKNICISNISKSLIALSKLININNSFNILEYIYANENDLFIFNLDKKIFTLNIFSQIEQVK